MNHATATPTSMQGCGRGSAGRVVGLLGGQVGHGIVAGEGLLDAHKASVALIDAD